MSSIIVSPRTEDEKQFILDLLKRLQIDAVSLSDEEKEDWGLGILMQEADMQKRVSREEIINKLHRK